MIARNCDWFMALFVPVVIGQSNCFGFGFFDSHLKTTLILTWVITRKLHNIPLIFFTGTRTWSFPFLFNVVFSCISGSKKQCSHC